MAIRSDWWDLLVPGADWAAPHVDGSAQRATDTAGRRRGGEVTAQVFAPGHIAGVRGCCEREWEQYHATLPHVDGSHGNLDEDDYPHGFNCGGCDYPDYDAHGRIKPMPLYPNANDQSVLWHLVWLDDYMDRQRWIGGTFFQPLDAVQADVAQYEYEREKWAAITPDVFFPCGHAYESRDCPYVDEMVD